MVGLSTAQLTRMRAQVEMLLPDTCVIQSATQTSDGAGGWSDSWTAVAGGTVLCRLDPIPKTMSRDDVRVGRETTLQQYRLTVPYDAPLDAHRRVVTGGVTYEIIELSDVHSWNVSRRAVVSYLE